MTELQPNLPVLLLCLTNSGLKDSPLQDVGRRRVSQTGGEEEGAPTCGGETDGVTQARCDGGLSFLAEPVYDDESAELHDHI